MPVAFPVRPGKIPFIITGCHNAPAAYGQHAQIAFPRRVPRPILQSLPSGFVVSSSATFDCASVSASSALKPASFVVSHVSFHSIASLPFLKLVPLPPAMHFLAVFIISIGCNYRSRAFLKNIFMLCRNFAARRLSGIYREVTVPPSPVLCCLTLHSMLS